MSASDARRAPLEARALTVDRGRGDVLHGVDLDVPAGRVTAVIGPNGCGKSTLLHALARVLRPRGGSVLLDGRELHRVPTRAVARRLALLPQSPTAPRELTVRDLVAFGRHPHRGRFGRPHPDDEAAVAAALADVGLGALAERPLETLSGGERQRAWIAMALAQRTEFLLLDEPTTSLDVAHQLEVLALVRDLNRRLGKTVVMVLHDLTHAARFADHLVAIRDGRVRAVGPPEAVVTAPVLRDVFGVEGRVLRDPELGVPLFVALESVDRPRDVAPVRPAPIPSDPTCANRDRRPEGAR